MFEIWFTIWVAPGITPQAVSRLARKPLDDRILRAVAVHLALEEAVRNAAG